MSNKLGNGRLFVLSAPSGTGKTTLLKIVMEGLDRLSFSVSHTTRSPRDGEKDGVDYHFVSEKEFREAIDENHFVEWAEVHGNFYGTSRLAIEKQLAEGIDVILDIDTQGAKIIRESDIDAVDLFVAPPSLKELEQRLRGRQTDSDESITLRLQNAKGEMLQAKNYQYLIVNDDLSIAARSVSAIILAERARGHRYSDGRSIILEIK